MGGFGVKNWITEVTDDLALDTTPENFVQNTRIPIDFLRVNTVGLGPTGTIVYNNSGLPFFADRITNMEFFTRGIGTPYSIEMTGFVLGPNDAGLPLFTRIGPWPWPL